MDGAKFYLETFGCQMNVLDSQLVAGQLRARGLTRVATPREADVVLFNTCSVRQHAEDKVLSRLGQLKPLKRRRPEVIVGVIGCMAEREREGLFAKAPLVDLLCGPGELDRLPALLDEVWQRHAQVTALAGSQSRRTAALQRALEDDSLAGLDLSRRPGPDERTLQAYIRVQRGCDKFCTYCVVPFTRGPERSRNPQHIVAEAQMLAAHGCRELTLLGQTVNSYVHPGDDGPVTFAKLLERVHAVDGIDRIRFVTSFPADWDADIFRVMRDYPKVCPYLHIPAQSGSDRILAAMRRGYTAESYLRLMDQARACVPDVALAGDFIVGFCGETEADFAATVDLVRRVQYRQLFVFKYSPRPGTAADRRQVDDVSAEVKIERNRALLAVQAEVMERQKRSLIGQTVEVLVEGYSKLAQRARRRAGGDGGVGVPARPLGGTGDAVSPVLSADASFAAALRESSGTPAAFPEAEQERGSEAVLKPIGRIVGGVRQLVGRTRHDQITVFAGGPEHIGALVRVRITSATALTLVGEIEGIVSPPRAVAAPDAITAVPEIRADGAGVPPGRPLPVL